MVESFVYISSYEYTICYCRDRRRPMVDVAVIRTVRYDSFPTYFSIVIVMCCCRS